MVTILSDFITDCLRGIFDTDGSFTFKKNHKKVNYYPVVKLYMKSKPLIKQVAELLLIYGIESNVQYDVKAFDKRGFISITHQLHINGKRMIGKFMEVIGTSNPKHETKYLLWRKKGFVKPGSKLHERMSELGLNYTKFIKD